MLTKLADRIGLEFEDGCRNDLGLATIPRKSLLDLYLVVKKKSIHREALRSTDRLNVRCSIDSIGQPPSYFFDRRSLDRDFYDSEKKIEIRVPQIARVLFRAVETQLIITSIRYFTGAITLYF